MARIKDRQKVLMLRKDGKSYSEIKLITGISKSTLSGWLHNFPLSPEQMRKVRDFSPRRIEHFRATMRKKRETKMIGAFQLVKKDLGNFTKREKFIAGLFLYWGEGGKTNRSTISLSNTDPAMLKFFLEWFGIARIPKEKLRVRLQLYSDMDIKKETNFWMKKLSIPERQFRKPYIKKSKRENIWHRGGHGHGTCIIIFESQPTADYVLMGIHRLREMYGESMSLRDIK